MVSFFLRWTLLNLFSSIPDEQSQQKIRQSGRITCAGIHTSNAVKYPLLWEIWIYNFSRRILERVFVGHIVNIRNGFLFFSFFFLVHLEWIVARICLSRTTIHSPWTQKKDTHSLNKQGNSENYSPPRGNKFDIEVSQIWKSRSRHAHGISWKGLY